jgi:hypothetical protein
MMDVSDPGVVPIASDYFPVDANIVQTVPQQFRRRSGFAPKVDAWTLLALWSLAERISRGSEEICDLGAGIRGVRMKLLISTLMEELGIPRSKKHSGKKGKRDFQSHHWSEIKASLVRLGQTELKFEWTRKVKVSSKIKTKQKYKIVRQPFKDSLISLDNGDPTGDSLDSDILKPRRTLFVTLALYNGIPGKYYVLVSRRLFALRPELDEIDTRLLFWLIRRHRGRGLRSEFLHFWNLKIDLDEIAGSQGLNLATEKRKVNRERLTSTIEKLEEVGILKVLERDPLHPVIQLSRGYFHNAEKAISTP